MKKSKAKTHARRHRNAVTTSPRPKRKYVQKLPPLGFDIAATAAFTRIIDDPDVPQFLRDYTAKLLVRSLVRRGGRR
jgi:hypothetical protein